MKLKIAMSVLVLSIVAAAGIAMGDDTKKEDKTQTRFIVPFLAILRRSAMLRPRKPLQAERGVAKVRYYSISG